MGQAATRGAEGINQLTAIYPNPRQGRAIAHEFAFIPDQYERYSDVEAALRRAGLQSSNLILGFDFTKSNETQGRSCFGGRSLHAVNQGDPNPYMRAVAIIGETLSKFDSDDKIPCYGFGDSSTRDHDVFSFYSDFRDCCGFEEALRRYQEIVPHIVLSEPTSYAPIIEMAISTVEQNGGAYHILLILADGCVTSNPSSSARLSPQEEATIAAVVKASEYALSIVIVGVGDGPWQKMQQYDDDIPYRAFDNLQFVNFTEIMAMPMTQKEKDLRFAVAALMEVPSQYMAARRLGYIGNRTGRAPERTPLPPPPRVLALDRWDGNRSRPLYVMPYGPYGPGAQRETNAVASHISLPPANASPRRSNETIIVANRPSPRTPPRRPSSADAAASAARDVPQSERCPICLERKLGIVFISCGHRVCEYCSESVGRRCHICRSEITSRIKFY